MIALVKRVSWLTSLPSSPMATFSFIIVGSAILSLSGRGILARLGWTDVANALDSVETERLKVGLAWIATAGEPNA